MGTDCSDVCERMTDAMCQGCVYSFICIRSKEGCLDEDGYHEQMIECIGNGYKPVDKPELEQVTIAVMERHMKTLAPKQEKNDRPVFVVSVSDVQYQAREMIGRELTEHELCRVNNMVCEGLVNADEIVRIAIDEVVRL